MKTEMLESLEKNFAFEPVEPKVMRVYAPFFHEDGDMLSIYLEELDNDHFILRDFGNTLMRVGYTFDLDTENKMNIVRNLVASNLGEFEDGELTLKTPAKDVHAAICHFSQIIAKVSNVDILRREVIRSMFYEELASFLTEYANKLTIQQNFVPTRDKQLVVDFQISGSHRPIYLFGVGENSKASKVVISCLTFQKHRVPFKSLIVHENFESLTTFNRNQITNAVDKQYTSLNDFRDEGIEYIERELAG